MRFWRTMCWGVVALMVLSAGFAAGATTRQTVPLEILEPAERAGTVKDFPVSLGLIFLEGEVTSAPGGAVVDDQGKGVPFDWEVTGWCSPERKSVKWLLLHFKASSDRKYSFVHGAEPTRPRGKPLAVESGKGIIVNTGPLQVRLAPGNAPVFESVSLNGRLILAPKASFFEMVDDEGRSLSCPKWALTLEENTPLRAVVKAEGIVAVEGQQPLAKLSVRYQFFAGKSFVRLYHTFIWMPRSLDPGANRIAMRLRPTLGDKGVVRVGQSDHTGNAHEAAFDPGADLVAYQDDADHYAVQRGGADIAKGRRLGGWISVEDADGRGVGVSLKNAWQTYPTALAVRKGDIDIGLWPEEAGRFSFEERDIMPDRLYYSRYWKYQTSWTRKGGPSWFNTKDLAAEHAADLFAKLKAQATAPGASPGKRIVSFLRPELQARLRNHKAGAAIADGFRARIAHGMNAFLEKRDFYDAASWRDVTLKPQAKELLDKGIGKLSDPELVWLNRLLIESAFPQAISPTDVPHHIHENAPFARGGGYVAHGQGAARTSEMTVLFYDRSSSRTPAQINSLTQHPFVMRQSPEHALRAPVFGFNLSPLNRQKHPDIERALDMYGRASFARYAETCDYGFLRFGMQHMNYPGQGLYRWMAGMQYDQQLIPWLLFLRGGDRRFYEEAMNTAAYAMDMQTNHYNTLGAPTGYMSFVASMPVPEGPTFSAYNMKIHFLSLCYHLTGYRRAGEVMDMAIEGVKQRYPVALKRSAKPVARQLYGMDMFCGHAYEETFDPAIKKLARASLDRTLNTHHDPDGNDFAGNTQYLYRGLLSLYRMFPEQRFREIMLMHLSGCGMPEMEWAGPSNGRSAIMLIACGWAYEQTKDKRYARILWDAARNLADIAPDHDWSSLVPIEYPLGHFAAYCHRVLPMLVALGVVDRNGLDFPQTSSIHDMFVGVNRAGSTRTAFARALKDGELDFRLEGIPAGRKAEISVAAFRAATGEKVAETVVRSRTKTLFTHLRRHTRRGEFRGRLTIPNAKKGEVYRLSYSKGGNLTTGLMALCDDAQIVHKIAPDTIQFFSHSYQYYIGTRVFMKMKDDTLRISRNRARAAFTVRDAKTHKVLARVKVLDPLTTQYRVGKGRMIELVLGAANYTIWKLEGIEPYVSARLQDWFMPDRATVTGR